jgi:hypothetical protein
MGEKAENQTFYRTDLRFEDWRILGFEDLGGSVRFEDWRIFGFEDLAEI